MRSTFNRALRAHIINTSLHEPRERLNWSRGLVVTLVLMNLLGFMLTAAIFFR